MVRRVSALSQVLKETQAQAGIEEQSGNTTIPEEDKTAKQENNNAALPQNDITILPQNDNIVTQQNDNTALPENRSTTKRQNRNTTKQPTRTSERDKVTYYLDPGQLDKLEDLRIAYRKATKKRLSEQDFMRMIVNKLDLKFLLQ